MSRAILNFFRKTKKYRISDIEILMNSDHQLPIFQEKFPLYDAFLPHLVSRIPTGWVIDVGANVGDTIVAMLQKCESNFLGIEPDPLYYSYLEKNVANLPPNYQRRVDTIRAFVSSTSRPLVTLRSQGTASSISADENTECPSLTGDEILSRKLINNQEVRLIKIDTDGNDYDCIFAFADTLLKSEPLLFWENAVYDVKQFEGNRLLYAFLEKLGYEKIAIFDNFGNFILTCSMEGAYALNDYLWNIEQKISGRTMYYADFLAYKKPQEAFVADILKDYVEKSMKIR